MLQIFGNKERNKKILIGIFICILPGFLLWGTSSVMKSSKEAGEYKGVHIYGKKVSAEEYRSAMQASKIQAMMQFGENYSQIEKLLDMRNLAIERIVLSKEAAKRGIKIKDDEVRAAIAGNEAFLRKGAFDQNSYDYIMRYVLGIQPRTFEEITRQNLALSRLYETFTSAVTAAQDEIRAAYEKQNEQISVSYISALPGDFFGPAAPSESEMKDYFDKNKLEFKQPVSFNLEYLTLETEPQAVGASQILEQKDGFDKVSGTMNIPVKETGFFPQGSPVPGIGWAPDLTEELLRVPKGTVLKIHQIDDKYYAFRVKEIQEPRIPEYETVTQKIKEILIGKKSKQLAKEKIDLASAKLKEQPGIDFDKLAQELGIKSSSTDPFKFGSYIQGIGASDDFFNEAKKLKDGEPSSAIEMPAGFYIIKVKDTVPVDEAVWEKEKESFSDKFLQQKKQEHFGQFIKDLKKKALGK